MASLLLQGWVSQGWLWEWPLIVSWPWWSASNTFCYLNNCTGQNEADWWQRSFPHVWWQLWVNNTDWSGTMANMKQKEEKLTFDFWLNDDGEHRTKRGEDDVWLLIDIKRVLPFFWVKMASIERIEEGDGVITVYFNSPYEVGTQCFSRHTKQLFSDTKYVWNRW